VLKAIVCLSKYLGCYEEYKQQLKRYGIKWATSNTSFSGFLSIFSKKHDTLPDYLREIRQHITASEYVFVKFLAVTGLRVNEAVESFHMIIDLYAEGKLGEYYDEARSVLEHYKYPKFLRTTKNAYLSFVSQDLIDQICFCDKISYSAIHCRLMRKKIKLRLKELRSYNNTYIRKNDVISELVDVLAGRVPKSVFCRHYLGEDIEQLSKQVLIIQKRLLEKLLSGVET
jgi:intergrase/recombinase